MNRRDFVRALALAPIAAATACNSSGSPSTVDLKQIAGDVADITAGLNALYTTPAIQAALSPAALKTLATALSEANAMAAQISGSTSAVTLPTAQNWVQTLATDTSTMLALVNAVPGLPPQVTTVVTAIQTLLPLIEVAVSLASTAAVAATPMTPTQARQILQNLT
jgi:hypothetical protein